MAESAITGLGIVSSLGQSVSDFSKSVLRGDCAIGDISDIVEPTQRVRIGAPVRGFKPTEHFDSHTLRHLDRFSQFAAVAARQAWAQAGLAATAIPAHRIGVAIGTGVAGIDILDDGFRRIHVRHSKPYPFTVPMTMGNAPASQIAHELGVRGPTFGVTSACASAAHAILLGHKLILSGEVDIFVVGGTDSCFSDGFLRAWDSLRALSPQPCRPFSIDRCGLSMGEGAGILVLESMQLARKRGAVLRGRLVGGGMSSDAGKILVPDASGMELAIRTALADAKLVADDIDYVNAHGTGTVANDKMEAAAINAVFGARQIPIKVSSTKSMIGHCMGASGAIEAIATLVALEKQIVPPTVNVIAPAPDCPIDITPNVPVAQPMACAISNSFAFGGINATLIFGKAE